MAATTPRTPALTAEQGLTKLATFPFQILTWVDADGYPVSVAVSAATRSFTSPA